MFSRPHFSSTPFPSILLSEVFETLSAGLSSGLTILTPNRRLARALKSEFDRTQAASAAVWNSADILPISAFIERVYRDALWSGRSSRLPVLLSPIQEQVLWENAISSSAAGRNLLNIGQAARLAGEAWQLAHAWRLVPRLNGTFLNEDAKAFMEWSRQYAETVGRAGRIDRARLSEVVLELLSQPGAASPGRLVCHGFDIVTPQQATLLAGFKEAGWDVLITRAHERLFADERHVQRHVQRQEFDDIRHEIFCAAVWARQKLESCGSARIGVVVPDLAARRTSIFRIFGSVME